MLHLKWLAKFSPGKKSTSSFFFFFFFLTLFCGKCHCGFLEVALESVTSQLCALQRIADAGIDLCLVTTACGFTKRRRLYVIFWVRYPWDFCGLDLRTGGETHLPHQLLHSHVSEQWLVADGQWFKVAIIIFFTCSNSWQESKYVSILALESGEGQGLRWKGMNRAELLHCGGLLCLLQLSDQRELWTFRPAACWYKLVGPCKLSPAKWWDCILLANDEWLAHLCGSVLTSCWARRGRGRELLLGAGTAAVLAASWPCCPAGTASVYLFYYLLL